MLRKKMLRDLRENKGAYIACLVIIIIGLMLFTSLDIVTNNLKLSKENFYREQNFADGFAEVKAMPQAEVKKLEDIAGIDKLSARKVKDVKVLMPDTDENVYLRLVSIDPDEANAINGVDLMQGMPLGPKQPNILIDNKFYEANELKLNQEIDVIADGKTRMLRIAGIGRSPEYVYALRSSSEMMPSPKTFGIAFVPFDVMDSMFIDKGTINSIVFTLKQGAMFEDVEEKLKAELKPYGQYSVYPRKDQVSDSILTMELQSMEAIARAMPLLFLSIAGVILYIMLKRIVEQQRGQIGILKAFGYTQREIVLHYMSYAVFVGIIGGLIGALLGIALSYPLTSMYQMFFNMPGLSGKFSPVSLIIGILLSLGFSTIAGFQGARNVLALQPAEAMRPPAPPSGRKTLFEKCAFLWNMLTVQGKMAIRNVSRSKGRAVFIFTGIMFSFAIIGLTWSMNDLIQMMLFDQYEKVETYDVKVVLSNPKNQDKAYRELAKFKGVNWVEPMAEIPVTLKNKWREKDVVLIGLPENSRNYNILDKYYNKIQPPKNGILLSERLAKLLDAKAGMMLKVESYMMETAEDDKHVQVTGVIPQYLGVNAYMEIGALQELLGRGKLATSFSVRMDKHDIELLKSEYRSSAVIDDISKQEERYTQSKELMASFGSMIYIYAVIGIIIGFAIIYNSSVVSLSERSHEIATMMVLGMTHKEVLSVVTFEQWSVGIFAMIAGIFMSKVMLIGMSGALSNDLYSIPTSTTPSSYFIAFFVTSLSIWVAQRAATRKIENMDLSGALKSRE
jgi:putative ABC transport system permease protein